MKLNKMKSVLKLVVMAVILPFFFSACSNNTSTEDAREQAVATAVSQKTTVENAAIVWSGSKVTGKTHTGTLALKESALEFEDGKLTGGSFIVDMASLQNIDVEGEYKQKLVNHLKSDDFFGVETYPTSSFKITSIEAGAAEGEYNVTGDLTIKATTLPQSFVAKVAVEGNQATTTANFNIDRAKYDVRYGSGSFFDDLGDKAINDEFNLDIKIVSSLGE